MAFGPHASFPQMSLGSESVRGGCCIRQARLLVCRGTFEASIRTSLSASASFHQSSWKLRSPAFYKKATNASTEADKHMTFAESEESFPAFFRSSFLSLSLSCDFASIFSSSAATYQHCRSDLRSRERAKINVSREAAQLVSMLVGRLVSSFFA